MFNLIRLYGFRSNRNIYDLILNQQLMNNLIFREVVNSQKKKRSMMTVY